MNPVLARTKPAIPTYDAAEEAAKIMAQFDPAELDAIQLFGGRLVVAKWIRTKAGNIILAKDTQNEDRYQGKVGLVIKVGPLAFVNDETHDWHGLSAKVGDWVMYGYNDGADFDYQPAGTFEKVPCKTIDETDVKMVLTRPDFAY